MKERPGLFSEYQFCSEIRFMGPPELPLYSFPFGGKFGQYGNTQHTILYVGICRTKKRDSMDSAHRLLPVVDKRGGAALFPGSKKSYVGYTMLCVDTLDKPSLHMEVSAAAFWVVLLICSHCGIGHH